MPPKHNDFLNALKQAQISYETGLSMAAKTTFRIGGKVQYAAFPSSREELLRLFDLCREADIPCALVGNGSNLLWDDDDFLGCVIFLGNMKSVTVCDDTVCAEAGARLSAVCTAARDAGLSGLSFAYGIPGSVGGAVYMNAGAYDGEVGQNIQSVTCYDLSVRKTVTFPKAECAFGYRTSVFAQKRKNAVILGAEWKLAFGDRIQIRDEMEAYIARRREKQPLEYPNAGSAFKRYPGYFTAKLIDEAGLKGYSIGGAQVSEKHAGFIINRGDATANDVRALLSEIEQRIEARYGIQIEPEIRTREDCLLTL